MMSKLRNKISLRKMSRLIIGPRRRPQRLRYINLTRPKEWQPRSRRRTDPSLAEQLRQFSLVQLSHSLLSS